MSDFQPLKTKCCGSDYESLKLTYGPNRIDYDIAGIKIGFFRCLACGKKAKLIYDNTRKVKA